MTVPVDVCNYALIRLGQDQIISLSDGTKAADLCDTMYPMIRDEMIRSHPWRRLKVRTTLAYQAGVTPAFPSGVYSYLLPADLVTLLDVWNGDINVRKDCELEAGAIITSYEGPLQVRYIRDSDDPNEWDDLMISAFSARLALALAEPLTQDATKVSQAARKFDEIESRARKVNAQEGGPTNVDRPDPWVSIRYGGSATDPTLRDIS